MSLSESSRERRFVNETASDNGDTPPMGKTPPMTRQQSRKGGPPRTHLTMAEEHLLEQRRLHTRFFSVLTDMDLLLQRPAAVDVVIEGANTITGKTQRITDNNKDVYLDSTEIQAQKLKQLNLFNPSGRYLMLWDFITIVAILYSVFDVPFQIGFLNGVPLSLRLISSLPLSSSHSYNQTTPDFHLHTLLS